MIHLFTHELRVFRRMLSPDNAGGDTIAYIESEKAWRVRVSPLNGEYAENSAGREYPFGIRIVGEVRDDIQEGDRVEYDESLWEITSLVTLPGIGSIPDYIRAKAVRIQKEKN